MKEDVVKGLSSAGFKEKTTISSLGSLHPQNHKYVVYVVVVSVC
jgi:hypothetical protein